MLQDDLKTELGSTRKQLIEAQDNQAKIDTKLNNVLVSVRNLHDEKNALESKLVQKQTVLQAQVRFFNELGILNNLGSRIVHIFVYSLKSCKKNLRSVNDSGRRSSVWRWR